MAKLTEAQRKQRAEYTKMRDIARKRILRAQAKGKLFDVPIPPTLKEIDAFVKEAQQNSAVQYAGKAISREKEAVKKFLKSEYSTEAGRRNIDRKRFEGYKKAGYTNINESNEQKFAKFMKHMISKYTIETPDGKKLLHDSDTIAEFFDEMEENDRIHEKTRLSDLVRMFNKWVG